MATVGICGENYPASATDAIGGEPVAVMAGEAHVRLHTWHGITGPYEVDNSQVLHLTVSGAHSLGQSLMAAADYLARRLGDHWEEIADPGDDSELVEADQMQAAEIARMRERRTG